MKKNNIRQTIKDELIIKVYYSLIRNTNIRAGALIQAVNIANKILDEQSRDDKQDTINPSLGNKG